jgi:hypothetical protein
MLRNDTVGGLPKDHSLVIDVGMTKAADFLADWLSTQLSLIEQIFMALMRINHVLILLGFAPA